MEDNDLADLLKDYIETKENLSTLQKASYLGYVHISKYDIKPAYEALDYAIKKIIMHSMENYEMGYHGKLRKK
jgi:hypothetical protein